MSAYVMKGSGITIDIKSFYTTARVVATAKLFFEEPRKVRGCSRNLSMDQSINPGAICLQSDSIEAPDSRKSSDPICIGNPFPNGSANSSLAPSAMFGVRRTPGTLPAPIVSNRLDSAARRSLSFFADDVSAAPLDWLDVSETSEVPRV